MKASTFILTLALILSGISFANAQQEEKTPEVKKRMVIINKTVDDEGNVTIEKTVKEGDEVDNVMWMQEGGEDVEVIMETIEGDEGKMIKIIGKGEGTEGKEKEVRIRKVETTDGKANVIIRHSGEEGEVKVMEWDGEGEMPAEMLELMNGKGMELEVMAHIKKIKRVEKVSESKVFLGVMLESKVEVKNEDGVETRTEGGLVVQEVFEGSAAEEAGLREGDVLTGLDGTSVKSLDDLFGVLNQKEPGDAVKISYTRDGSAKTATANLKERKEMGHQAKIFMIDGNETHTIENADGEENVFIIINETKGADGEHTVTCEKKVIVKTIKEEKESPETTETPKLNTSPSAGAELKLDEVSIFPNPTDGLLQVQFKAEAAPTTISITDMSGKEIYREFLGEFSGTYNRQINVEDAAKGTLILSVHQGDKVFSDKIMLH